MVLRGPLELLEADPRRSSTCYDKDVTNFCCCARARAAAEVCDVLVVAGAGSTWIGLQELQRSAQHHRVSSLRSDNEFE